MQGTWAFQWVPDTFEKTKQEMGVAPLPQLSPKAPDPIFVLGIGADLAINAASQVAEGCAMVLDRMIDYAFVEKMSAGVGRRVEHSLRQGPAARRHRRQGTGRGRAGCAPASARRW